MGHTNLKFLDKKLQKEKAYWSQKLSGQLVATGLPLDYARPEACASEKDEVRLTLDGETARKLFKLCGKSESLILTTLVAAQKICLHKYTGNTDILIGTAIHERYSGVSSLNKVLILRDQISAEMTSKQLLLAVKSTISEAYSHQKYPFDRILDLLDIQYSANRAPLLDVVAILDNPHNRECVSHLKNDITFAFQVSESAVATSIRYNPQLFSRATILLFGEHYERILNGLLDAPDAKISELEMLSTDQKHQLLFDLNDTSRAYPQQSFNELFEAQVQRTPDAIAVECEAVQLTYRELNERANQLAHHLQVLGVGTDSLVAILMERSVEMVVALLGVLKAGAAYVPLDASHPPARLNFILQDTSAAVLLTQQHLAEQLSEHSATVLCLDAEAQRAQINQQSIQNPSLTVSATDLAYVIYTSGSTGQPKGVQIAHRSLVNYLSWASDTYLCGQPLSFALYSSLAFDLTVTSIFLPLISGARLLVYPGEAREGVLDQILSEDKAEALKLTPSHLRLIAERDNRQSRVRRLIVGGEALPTQLAEAVMESFGGRVEIYNEYGPTEATVGCSVQRYEEQDQLRVAVPIGRPAANTRLYVLDARMRAVPVGVEGELYIGGDGLAEGYLNREELTEERFIADPFVEHERVYRSGDRARWLADGRLEYLGRGDEQVKRRGVRVELGELRAALNSHQGVRDSLVLVRQGAGGREVLVCYYVSRQEIESEELRQHMAERVLVETVPEVYVHLRKMPLTLNGKVNVEGLPEWEAAGEQRGVEYVAARDEVEAELSAIWSSVLGVERVSVGDNFFSLGGHSLLATQVVSQVRERLGVEVGLKQLFERPTIEELAERVKETRASIGAAGAAGVERIGRVSREGELGLSYAQQRLWFLDQLEPGSAAYNTAATIRITGQFCQQVLERSLSEIVCRHEALRTTFAEVDGQPVQLISPPTTVHIPLTDLSALPNEQRHAHALTLAAQEARLPFDLAAGPLLRVTLLRLEAEEHLLLITMHHIISDGWSLGVMVREIKALYAAFAAGEESPLAELEIQYADFAAWQREWLTGDVLDTQLRYWEEQLTGAPPVLELPTDRPRPAIQSYRGARQEFKLTPELSQELKQLSQREGCTLFMTLLAAFQVLLSRYSGQEDVVAGTPIANRNRAEIEPLIGFFVNTLALRTDLSGEPSFREVLRRVREVTLGAYGHQDVPFEKLVERLQPERSLSHQPVFQVMFALQNAPRETLNLPGLQLELWPSESQTTKFDLLLSVSESAEGLSGVFEYSTDLFDEQTIIRLRQHFEHLLQAITRDAEQQVAAINLLTAAEHEQIVVQWNETSTEYPQETCVHELFAAQVERTPDAIAVECQGVQLTYQELNERANQLAYHLHGLGVGVDSLVAILMERSVEMVVALLGVLKAGAAYVPLDASHPPARLGFILQDTSAAVLLTQQHLAEQLSEHSATVVFLDAHREREQIAGHSVDNPAITVSAADLAYVIYTSGSTGQPKGVCVPHRGVTRLVTETTYASFSPDEVFLQLAPVSFDAATFELWGALLNGARLVVMPPQQPSLSELAEAIERYGITTLWLTAGLFHLMVEEQLESLGSLRQLLAGGDVLSAQDARRVLEAHPGLRLINGYGPTEATTFTCCHPIVAADVERGRLPIGRPIANTQVYILDERLSVVPVGVEGELYIGGDGLARGYLNEPGLTAEKFIPHPFGRMGGARLYRSGDRARWLADGSVEFLGRTDNQVKVRGFRVELGEVEEALRQQACVGEAVALVSGEGVEKRIVAYVVCAAEESQESQPQESAETIGKGIRERVGEQLPEHMAPAVVIVMQRLPLTPNGKIDRRALALLEPEPLHLESQYEAPRTPVEEILCGIWGNLLRVERVGITDNFFESGGHSLLATQLVSRVRAAFGAEIALKELFESPTVAELAERIEAGGGLPGRTQIAGLERVSRGEDLPASFAQQRMWFLYQMERRSAAYNLSSAMRLSGALNTEALERSLCEMVRRHEILRTTFSEVEGQLVQVVEPARAVRLGVRDLSGLDAAEREAEAARVVVEETGKPFDLEQGPLLRTTLLRLDEEKHMLVVCMHHIISDGWSLGVMVREIKALYAAFATGEESPLAELEIQYADFAAWQREWLTGEVLDEQLTYWKEQLKGAPPVLELPTDRPRPAVQSYRGARQSFFLSEELTAALTKLSQREGCTLFMTLLAAFQVLLSRYSGQEDVVVGTPIANRNRAEVEPLIGFFVNTLALRTDLSGEPSFREVLKRVREVTLSAYAHQDVPFEKLVEELQPERSLSHQPVFQVVLALQNASHETLELPGLQLSTFSEERKTAKFDLLLNIWNEGQGLAGGWEYSTDLFDEQTINRFQQHFEHLLQAVALDAEQQVATIPLLSAAEHEQLVVQWNETATRYPQETCVHGLFEQQVALHPDVIAVECEAVQLTYRELNERANQLAYHLHGLGVGADSLVAILMERSVEMVVALLGVLKAGAAYVPLDASHPSARLNFILQDTAASVLLTQQHLVEQLPEHTAQVVLLDSDWEEISSHSRGNSVSEATAEQLAYVIYTSGSTGQPKGVQITHRSLVNYLSWASDTYLCGQPLSFALYSSLAFDLTVTSIFLPLISGSRLLVYPGEAREGVLDQILSEDKVEALKLTPSHLRLIAERDNRQSRVRRLIVGGEALPTQLAEAVMESFGGRVEIYNEYGPTEATVGCSVQRYEEQDQLRVAVPIGRPAANTRLYVLDARMRAVPVGVEGELYIGGDGLAEGYLNREELTEERFIADPFVEHERVYRSGDRARWLADGRLEYLGRGDEQVKRRGVRVELGELRAALNSHQGVRDSLVLVRQGAGGREVLVGYYVSRQEIDSEELRRHMAERVLVETVPEVYVHLRKMPLTLNGKVNVEGLPEWEAAGEQRGAEYVGARDEVEAELSAIWCGVLGVERVSVEANFFSLGGHSLLATQVVSQIRERLGVEVGLKQLFERPTIEELAERVKETRASIGAAGAAGVERIGRVSREGELGLSYAQQRLWFLDQLEPGSAAYNIPIALRLSGRLEVSALERVLSEVVRRHEVLRTSFMEVDGQPVQVISPPGAISIPFIDLSHLSGEERQSKAQESVSAETRRAFDLAQGPLLRATLLRLDDEEHVLLVCMHHIVSDGWSMGLFIREMSALYAAFAAGEESPLAELEIQYADFAAWQREWLTGDVLDEQLTYWKEQLKGAPPVLELPADRARPPLQSYRGAQHSFTLCEELTTALRELSRREGCTLFMTLLAAFQMLLSRYSGQEDVVVGTPIANRNRAEVEPLIGFFVNTLALRTDISGEPSFREVLRRVRDVTLSAYANQDVPFEKLVEELQPERSLSHQPIFQVMFALQNATRERLELPGLRLELWKSESRTTKFDLLLSMSESGEGLSGAFEYSTDLFDEQTIIRLEQHFEHLLQEVVSDAEQQVATIPLLSAVEQEQLVVQWNQTSTEYPREACVHELFEQQAALRPDVIAVECQGVQLTYRELNERANQLAHHLRSLGVGTDSLVGVLMERSTEMVVALLGVLKAGAAYVPLDVNYPAPRLQYMLEQSQATVLLTQQGLAQHLPAHSTTVLCLDAETQRALLTQQSTQNPALTVSSEQLAYVIYTSGSTGQPKGVCVPHRGVTRLVTQTTYASFSPDEVFLQLAPVSFDAATFELWGALLNGARLVVMPPQQPSLSELAAAIQESGVTTLWLTAGLFHLMVEEQLESLGSLRQLLAGGDVLSVEDAAKVVEAHPELRLINGYGPTEGTTFTCCHPIVAADVERGRLPIGRPIANTQVYILDERLSVVPVGVEGELYIGGDGLARGYLNQPELTAAQFIPHPLSGTGGARLYRSGDRARWLADGSVEFLGRTDNQVKVRGFRVELGEVEAALRQQGGVSEAVVLVSGTGVDKRLVAYVSVAGNDEQIGGPELRQRIREQLPEYMAPARVVIVERLPLTANGKIDRRALTLMDDGGAEVARPYIGPRTEVEEVVAGIWRGVLSVERVGVEDNFFEIGGHSLLATQVISRVREALQVKLALGDLFASPTLESFAGVVEGAMLEQADLTNLDEMLDLLEQMDEGEAEGLLVGEGENL